MLGLQLTILRLLSAPSDVTRVGTDVFSLAHSEYAERRELLNDIALLFRKGERPPNSRTPILQTVKVQGQQYWRFPAS